MRSIKRADEKDAAQLDIIIRKEFAYKKLSKEKIIERMGRPEITVFKKTIGNKLAGFVEVELLDEIGMVNALSVKESFRRRGFGRELLEYALGYLEESEMKTARLLVKMENSRAKKLYSSCGFEFARMHDKKLGGKTTEVWEKQLLSEHGDYLN